MNGGHPARKMPYAPGLDGLRAIAVIAVVLYHGQDASGLPQWLEPRGGFLGVEVFFVISGYLITALLLDEWERSGSVDLGSFWVRRARRLLPALATRISSRGKAAIVARVAARSVTSKTLTDALPPAALISSASAVSSGLVRAAQMTSAPESASASAQPRPRSARRPS